MYKALIIIATVIILPSCSRNHDIKITQQNIEKPSIEFYTEIFEKPKIIIDDKCNLMNNPNITVICMTYDEYDKDIKNYSIMLEIIKQYQILKKYYESIK